MWQRQTKDFGHGQNTNRDQSTKYSVLVFDNRGIGRSDKPLARYSTSEMAKDTIDLVNHIGWTSDRQLHCIGVSMGGMIAQEMVIRYLCFLQNSYTDKIGAIGPQENGVLDPDVDRTETLQYCRLFRKSSISDQYLVWISQ